jgi:hypothetical protein
MTGNISRTMASYCKMSRIYKLDIIMSYCLAQFMTRTHSASREAYRACLGLPDPRVIPSPILTFADCIYLQ